MAEDATVGTPGEPQALGTVPEGTATIPSHTTEVKPGEENTSGEFKIPEEYQDKAYLKDVTSYEDMFKKLDGAQKLIGQKSLDIPGENATPEERAAFNEKRGVPKTADEYELIVDEKAPRNESFEKGIKGLFHKADLTPAQAKVIQEGFTELTQGLTAEMTEKSDADFDKLSKDVFGDNAEQALADAKKLIDANKPANIENFDEYLKGLNNKELIVMGAVLNNIKQKYIKEDAPNQEGTQQAGDVDSLRQEAVKLMGKPEYSDKFHKDHKATFDRVQEIYKTMGRILQR